MRKLHLIEEDDDGCCCCHRCCQRCTVPMQQYWCMYPDLVAEYHRLRQRYCDSITKRERLWALARPKLCKKPCLQTCRCTRELYKNVEIKQREVPIHTRTEQLAYPLVSTLLHLKKRQSFLAFPKKRKRRVNRVLRKSLLSLYSRLSNTQTPKRPEPKKKWSQEDWTRHMKYIGALATVEKKTSGEHLFGPQGPNKAVYADAKTVGPNEMRHIKKLAKPKHYKEPSTHVWHLTQSMRKFTPSERLLLIAKPKSRFDPHYNDGFEVRPEALYYRATDRIRELALPSEHYRERQDLRENPFSVVPRALKAKASERIINLATPRAFSDTHTRPNPFSVSKKALRAVISPRMRELARPRQHI